MKPQLSLGAVALILAASSAALAQTGGAYTMDRHTVDGGGGVSQGSGYELSGTAGQPDAGSMAGGAYTMTGGFWPLASGGAVAARPMPDDAFDIDGTVRACTTDADCLAGLGSTSEVYCVPAPTASGGDGVCYVRRNRYVVIKPNVDNAGLSTARRIRLSTGEVLGWIGQPVPIVVGGPEPSPQALSRIQSTPHYMDWSTVDTVHIGDCAVVPEFVYEIQAIVSGEDEGSEASYSEPLVLSTVLNISGSGGYGDVVGAVVGLPPDGNRNFKDIMAVVRGFQSAQAVPKSWLDLQGPVSAPMCPGFGGGGIDFNDVDRAISGFQGGDYLTGTGFLAPLDCPPSACPPLP